MRNIPVVSLNVFGVPWRARHCGTGLLRDLQSKQAEKEKQKKEEALPLALCFRCDSERLVAQLGIVTILRKETYEHFCALTHTHTCVSFCCRLLQINVS